jgi:hypothetical protein
MTDHDDVANLNEVIRSLSALDVEPTTAEQIARRARNDVGRGRSPLRFVEPAIAAILAAGYLAWAVIKVIEALGG